MLVLSRRIGERICIGEDIVLTVTDIHPRYVRLGIEAPRAVPIWRAEVAVRSDKAEQVGSLFSESPSESPFLVRR
jgi:carbon storage regulator